MSLKFALDMLIGIAILIVTFVISH